MVTYNGPTRSPPTEPPAAGRRHACAYRCPGHQSQRHPRRQHRHGHWSGHGVAATDRRVEYLPLRLAQLTRNDAADALGISRRTALNIDKRVINSHRDTHRERFAPAGSQAKTYNRLMQAMLECTADSTARNATWQVRASVDATR